MACPLSGLVALLVLTIIASSSLACTVLQTHSQENTRALILLGQRKRISSFSCLKDRQDFGLAQLQFDGKQVQKAQALSVLYEMTRQTFMLFTSQDSSAAWNQSLLGTFCTGLHQQLNELQACLTQEVGLEQPLLMHEDSRLAVRKYFHRITAYLKEKSYSPCAWEVVRAEIIRSFSSSDKLATKMKH